MSAPFEQQLAVLTRQRGVLGCLVVSEDDGIIVSANVRTGTDERAVAALAASLYRRARLSARAAGLGAVSFLHFEAERGHICAAGRDALVLVTIAESGAQVGRLRTIMLQRSESAV
jgi:predicted regulator of Ras-like GTPase activity (Roadblock/LC7/MglB family)